MHVYQIQSKQLYSKIFIQLQKKVVQKLMGQPNICALKTEKCVCIFHHFFVHSFHLFFFFCFRISSAQPVAVDSWRSSRRPPPQQQQPTPPYLARPWMKTRRRQRCQATTKTRRKRAAAAAVAAAWVWLFAANCGQI